MKKPLPSLLLFCLLSCMAKADDTAGLQLVDVRRIWDKAPHSAFTDLIHFKGRWYCTFREARNHWGNGASGKIRVIKSTDGNDWEPVALFSMAGDLGVRIGGPNMIQLPSGRFLAAARLYDGKTRTSLCWLDPEKAELTEALTLPSGGDTSYAGLVWQDDLLWGSYYSSHEGKVSIYLAKVKLPDE